MNSKPSANSLLLRIYRDGLDIRTTEHAGPIVKRSSLLCTLGCEQSGMCQLMAVDCGRFMASRSRYRALTTERTYRYVEISGRIFIATSNCQSLKTKTREWYVAEN